MESTDGAEMLRMLRALTDGQATLVAELKDFKEYQVNYNKTTEDRLATLEVKSHRASPLLGPTRMTEAPAEPAPTSSTTTPPTGQQPARENPRNLFPSLAADEPADNLADEEPMFDPTGLPITPAPGKMRKQEKKQRAPDRRDTLHLHNLRLAQERAQLPVIHGVLAPWKGGNYSKSNVTEFFRFFKELRLYELKEGVRPRNVPALVDDTIRERLISYEPERLGGGKFLELEWEELYGVLQKEFRPKDRIDFIKKLDDSVGFEFTSHYKPTADYFKPFYDALLLYISKFSEVFDILSFGITHEQNIVPRCDTKPGGLVKTFVSKIPFQFGANILLLLPEQKWETWPAFMRTFRAELDVCKDDSESSRRLKRLFTGSKSDSQTFEKKLQYLQELRALPAEAYEDQDLPAVIETQREELEEQVDDLLAAMQASGNKTSPQKFRPDRGAPARDPQKPRDPLACITFILTGACNKTNCTYSHQGDLITRKRYEFLEQIQARLGLQKTPGPPRGQLPQRAAAMVDTLQDDEEY